MKLLDLDKITDDMLSKFVDQLGWDGKAYVSYGRFPMLYLDIFGEGQFFTAESPSLKRKLDNMNIPLDESLKEKIYGIGLIAISNKYRNKPGDDSNLLATIIHEKIHAHRMVLAHLPDSGDPNIEPIFYDDGRFVRNSNKFKDGYIDPAQDILLGSIDDARSTVERYKDLSFEEKDDLQYANDNVSGKMMVQRNIDETLVELMTIITLKLSKNKFNNIMDILKDINARYEDSDIAAMARIILRHNDLELFKWMLDPINYQFGSIHYDFFSNYINEDDKEDVTIIANSTDIGMENISFDGAIKR